MMLVSHKMNVVVYDFVVPAGALRTAVHTALVANALSALGFRTETAQSSHWPRSKAERRCSKKPLDVNKNRNTIRTFI